MQKVPVNTNSSLILLHSLGNFFLQQLKLRDFAMLILNPALQFG
jgi:hypothetical protein